MRRRGPVLLATFAGTLAAGIACAGGPLILDSNGTALTWGTFPVEYRTDGGRLSVNVSNAQAQTRVANMFNVWEDVPSASISYDRVGAIQDTGAFTDGDVNTAAEFNALSGATMSTRATRSGAIATSSSSIAMRRAA
jgi:hypothetical protein